MESLKALWYTAKLPVSNQKYEKNSNIAVFEIANNFIVVIQFLEHRLATKKLGSPKVPRNITKLPVSNPKI